MCIWTPLKKAGDLSGDTAIPPEVGLGKHTSELKSCPVQLEPTRHRSTADRSSPFPGGPEGQCYRVPLESPKCSCDIVGGGWKGRG